MKYEIGQKVETQLGVGIIYTIQTIKDQVIYKVDFEKKKLNFLASFVEEELKPYKTPHERFIEMGLHLKITKNWAGGVFSHEWWNDNNDRVVVFFVDEKVTTVYEGNNDIMRIIPDYLEWLEEEK